jgi:hypothetical protein
VKRPEGIHNEPLWIKHCTKIRARALDLIEGSLDLFSAARALHSLAILTRAKSDPDLLIFERIDAEIGSLPTGPERAYWAAHALEREDKKIHAVEGKWREIALAAAKNLVERYAWSPEARAELRKAGGSSRVV